MKKLIGKLLWLLSGQFVGIRNLIKPYGLRTSQEWFPNKVSLAQSPSGNKFRLTGVEENYLTFQLHWMDWKYYEPVSILLVRELLRNGGTFLDVGANIGYYSLIVASECPDVKIVAFEPNIKLQALLKKNVALNDFPICSESVAVSSTTGEQTFFVPESDMSGSLEQKFHSCRGDNNLKSETVRTVSLDDYLDPPPAKTPLVIKIDVEGHEPSVLAGGLHCLTHFQPDIILEVVLDYDKETEELLTSRGYRFYHVTREGLRPSPNLVPSRAGDLIYMNYLLSTRAPEEVAAIFERIRPTIESIDFTQTSKFQG